MDPTTFSGAGTAVTAADPNQPTAATGAPVAPNGLNVEQSTAPETAVSPQTESQAPAAPQYSQQDIQRWQAAERERNQIVGELQQLAVQQQRQQQEQQFTSEVQNRLNVAYQAAEQMEPIQAIEHIKRAEEQERARLAGRIRETEQQAEQRMMATLAQVTAPLYAQQLARDNGLPAEYAERLSALNPYQMDQYVPVLKREYESTKAVQDQLKSVLARLEQYERSNQADQLANTGVHNPGGSGASPIGNGNANGSGERGSRDHLLSIPGVAAAFGLRNG